MFASLLKFAAAAAIVSSGSMCAAQPLTPKLEKLEASGNVEAVYHLAMIKHLGLEGARDPKKALALFRKAADGGDPLAAYKLGCYYDGQGDGLVRDDPAMALRYKLMAATAGYALAQHDVAMLYYRQDDPAQALSWMNKAAAQGYDQSLMALASLYNVGVGIPQDRVKTLAYFAIARSRSGKPLSEAQRKWRSDFEKQMSVEDRQRAERIASKWRANPHPLTIKGLSGQRAAALLVASSR